MRDRNIDAHSATPVSDGMHQVKKASTVFLVLTDAENVMSKHVLSVKTSLR